MARGQSPLARAQARALSADTPPPAASPETSVFVMAPPAASPGADGGSLSRPPLAGFAEVSAPSSLPTASTGDASGEGSESSVAQPDDALSLVLGAVPRWAADAPEAASSAGSADSQPQGSVSGSGGPVDGASLAADAPEAPSAAPRAHRFSSVRWEDIEDIVTVGTDCTVRQVQESAQSRFLALARLMNRRPPLRTDYELDQRLEAAGSLLDLRSVVRSTSDLKQSACATKLRTRTTLLLRTFGASGWTMPMLPGSSWRPTLRWNRALKLPRSSSSVAVASTSLWRIPTKSSAKTGSNSRPASLRTPRSSASSGTAATSGSSTSLTVDSDTSDDLGQVVPSAPHKGNGKRPAKSSAKPRSAPPPPKKKKLRLGRPSVDLKARKAVKQAASAATSSSGSSQCVPSSLPAVSVSTSSAPVPGIAVSADSGVLSFASVPSGSNPPFSPIPRTPTPPASSTVSTASVPSTPVGPSGVTPGTEASVPVEIDDDGGSGADGATSAASVAPGGVFSSPVVSQSRRDGRPTRAASTTTGRRSMAAVENEAAPDTLVLGLAALSNTPATTQASVARSTSTPDPAESAAVVAAASAAVVTSASGRRRVANTHGPDSPSSCGGYSDPSASLGSARPDSGYGNPVHDAWDSAYGF
ncbi:unnamed protein product [Phytophthora fragariaefolia]|uniref:Unnamed protein product n=1 Tax=Phytophthora fragariaefolia TaxID=1490495 RepID=A0A9W6WYB5_9STRA|nr:unnamed protein product [Phytophthora fragariaefolia]